MSVIISVVVICLMLGILITVHEFGHFIAARLCGIEVTQFAIGMGPVLYRRQKKDANGEPSGTLFTIRALPIGGFCNMAEDEDSDDPAHFRNKNIWQKLFVLSAGSLMNVLAGMLMFFIFFLFLIGKELPAPVITELTDDCPYAGQIMPGDRFYSINGNRIYNDNDLEIFLTRDTDKPYTFVLQRGNERVTVPGVERKVEIKNENGEVISYRFGFSYGTTDRVTLSYALRHTWYYSVNNVRLIWMSLGDLISGAAEPTEMMGPVGIGGVVNQVVQEESISAPEKALGILTLAGVVAVNLAVMNLLPIPALDGGRILFLFISAILILIRKKPLSAKIEGYIHGVTMLLLFSLMFFIFFNDIMRLINF